MKLLGIDIGTSGCKGLLIDEEGKVLKRANAEYPISIPQPLWSEQNPEDWWVGVQSCLAQIDEPHPDAIGLSGQMHGAVFLDDQDEVIRPSILWNDQRTVAECADINEIVGAARLRQITCNPPLTGFQLPKILWLRNHEPHNYGKLKSVLLPKDYIRFRLTGEKVSEVSDASGTGAFNVPSRSWSDEIINRLGLPKDLFPPVTESFEASSSTSAGVPVAGGGGDQAAGAVGTGAVEAGIISVSLGTSGVVFSALDAPTFEKSGAAHTFCHANGAWHAMGVMLSCGGSLKWFRDLMQPGGGYAELEAQAARVGAGADGLTFLPYLTGERTPHNDPTARGAWIGLSLASGREAVSRSVFEGISFGLLDCYQVLQELGAKSDQVRVTGGGAKSSFWLQMLADVFQTRCVTLGCDEGPAFGAAILAGVSIGVWSSVQVACRKVVSLHSEVAPSGVDYSGAYARYRALYPALKGLF